MFSLDGPGRLVSGAAATLPAERSEWGRAMVAELAVVAGRAARWSFAVGCVRVVLLPAASAGRRAGVAGAVALVVVIGAALASGAFLPALQALVIALAALVGLAVVVSAGLGNPLRPADPVIAVAGIVGAVACVASLGYFLDRAPGAAYLGVGPSVYLAVVLAVCLWLRVAPHPWVTSSPAGRWAGLAAALVLAAGFVGTSRLTVWTVAGTAVWIVLAPGFVFLAAGLLGSVTGRSMTAGLQTTVWTGVLGSLAVFALAPPEAVRRYAIDARLLFDGERGYPIEQPRRRRPRLPSRRSPRAAAGSRRRLAGFGATPAHATGLARSSSPPGAGGCRRSARRRPAGGSARSGRRSAARRGLRRCRRRP